MPPCFERWCQRFDDVFPTQAQRHEFIHYLGNYWEKRDKKPIPDRAECCKCFLTKLTLLCSQSFLVRTNAQPRAKLYVIVWPSDVFPKNRSDDRSNMRQEFDAPEKVWIKLRNIAYDPTDDRGITGDRSSKLARHCKNCLTPPKIMTYLQKLAQLPRLYISEKKL